MYPVAPAITTVFSELSTALLATLEIVERRCFDDAMSVGVNANEQEDESQSQQTLRTVALKHTIILSFLW
jgi:hypothetical protein